MACGIYQWTVRRPGKSQLVYVGQSTRIEVRRNEYITGWGKPEDEDTNNIILRRAVLKYGAKAVKFGIIEPDVPVEQLTERERYWFWRRVEELGRENVANIIEPGENPMHDPEVRARQVDGVRRANQDPEYRQRKADHCRALADAQRGPVKEKETLEQRAARLGEISRATRDVVAAQVCKTYEGFVSPSGEVYAPVTNLREFCRQWGLDQPSMVAVASGRRQQHKGWTRYQPE